MQQINNMQSFFYDGKKEVRTAEKDGQTLWIIKDVCGAVGIENHRVAAARLDDEDRCLALIDTPGGQQKMIAVRECGLYSLIMLSRKPEAKKFQRWVTHEVLPSIRKHCIHAAPIFNYVSI
jgi:prophage antirepressor-like protein